ncbi:hypothetical protein [Bacillus sp. EB600]|uniref:hypothetical protein n=1 Tax=Bacillus sp. EB600 TaxID=2806345 RepID=UPI00210CFC19|nr:hypothetical protein [Bacillus sp. EB600]MCQ6281236.1 hypothetical protein [Bacillus sp. EB600]
MRPEEFMGKHVTSFYKNLTNKNSTITNVLKTGNAVCDVKQELIAMNGSTFQQSILPIPYMIMKESLGQ